MKKFPLLGIILISLFLLVVYFILTRIFGHSATNLVINTGIISMIGGSLLYNTKKLNNLNRELGEFKVKTINSFDNMKKDMNFMKKRFTSFDKTLINVDKKITRIERKI